MQPEAPERLEELVSRALDELENVKTIEALDSLKTRLLGRKGLLAEAFAGMRTLPEDRRGRFGKQLNEAKACMLERYEAKKRQLETGQNANPSSSVLDVSLPGPLPQAGKAHPISQVQDEILAIFLQMGYSVAKGPELEDDYHNFEALNIPKHHPARDMQDTFFVQNAEGFLLRTHTSPVQIRVMERLGVPVQVVAPGRVYRRDFDPTHSPMFHQVEGLMIDKDVSFAGLIGTLDFFSKRFFGPDAAVRFRPSYFPFTEPSAEVDVRCIFCKGEGCRVCKNSGYLEVLGCGMVHPAVLEACRVDPDEWQGFAFGLGVERLAMLKLGIDDIRLFYENHPSFLPQF
jgi:phenylalanyl-tRNA synthetase alpha chain